MGIKGGTQIKQDIRGGHEGVLFREPALHGGVQSLFYTRSRARIIDCMLELYYRPPHCVTGAQLCDWFFRTRILPATQTGQILVLVFDNQKRTPRCKAACQAKRRTRARTLDSDLEIGDDAALPDDWYGLMATSKLRLRMFAYLLGCMQKKLERLMPHEILQGGAVYCSPPYLEDYLRDETGGEYRDLDQYKRGEALEMTRTDLLPALPETCQGEGDLLCKVWAQHLAKFLPEDSKILVKTKDWDTVCAFLTTPPVNRVCIHVGDIKPKKSTERKQLEYVDIYKFYYEMLKGDQQLALNYVMGNILSGSDYCEGVYGVSGRALLRTLLKMPREKRAVLYDGASLRLSRPNLKDWIRNSKRGSKPLKRQPRMLKRASWNLVYWLALEKRPNPINFGGWAKETNGILMPIEDS